jgi:hypothetical protein
MLAFQSMLVPAAKEAGMKVPPDELLDEEDAWNKNDYPHFFVFLPASAR